MNIWYGPHSEPKSSKSPKNSKFFFAQIDSEASETYNKSIFCENKCLKKIFNWLGEKGGSVLNNPCGFVPDIYIYILTKNPINWLAL